ncbi:hypothetical protein ABI59_09685 [Acidobacteria bacterium Mor1]|nr:hypothetical protein ABI59_09685 [Acidobacteria bacterium Mor1]
MDRQSKRNAGDNRGWNRDGEAAPRVQPDRSGPLHVEIVSVGRELIKGRVRDANAPFIADYFTQRGALVHRITLVDDVQRAIASSVREALSRQPNLVVVIGGLGPSDDDRTLEGVSDAVKLPLKAHTVARQMVEDAYLRLRKRKQVWQTGLTAAREKICALPVNAEAIANEIGVVPGMFLRMSGGTGVLCLPGSPEEMRSVFDNAIPVLKELAPKGHLVIREVEAPTGDESAILPMIETAATEHPGVWIKAHAPGFDRRDAKVLISLEASAPTRQEAESMVEAAFRRLMALAAGVR